VAVAFFVLTSIFIGVQYATDSEKLNMVVTVLFLIGMVLVLIGVIFAAYETKKGYDIIHLEIKVDE